MVEEKPMANEGQEARPLFEKYVKLASDFVSGPLRSRSGFAALRFFKDAHERTVYLAVESSFTVYPEGPGWSPWGFVDPDFFYYMFRRGPARFQLQPFFCRWLASPSSYSPRPIWALFWALAMAEHDFLRDYVPSWSNEERLTGHLVSEIVHRLRECAPHWAALSESSNEESACRIFYADTATSRREQITGADLGLIIHAKFPGQEQFLKVARFQAKKAENNKARIRLDQTERLLNSDKVGYYLFYHDFEKKLWTLPPTVEPAERFKGNVKEAHEKSRGLSKDDTIGVDTQSGFDFATFVTFALVDQSSEHGAVASDPIEAVNILLSVGDGPPTRVLVVSLGPRDLGPSGPSGPSDWGHLLDHFDIH